MSLEQAIEQNTRAIVELTQILRAQMAQVPAAPAPVPAPLSEIAPPLNEVPVNNPEPLPAELFDADTVRDAFIAFARTHGRAGQLEALAQFGVAKLGELPESSYGDMMHFLNHYSNLHGASNA
jgi:hypothetical protein